MSFQIVAGQLPFPFCHEDWQSTFETFVAAMSISEATTTGQFTIGPTAPAPEDRDKLWYNSTEREWYYPDLVASAWVRRYPVPPTSKEVRMWSGSTAELWSYDGGDGTDPDVLATVYAGSFWKVIAAFEGRSPIGTGKIGGTGTDLAVGTSYGSEEVTLDPTTVPLVPHWHPVGEKFGDLTDDNNFDFIHRPWDIDPLTVTVLRLQGDGDLDSFSTVVSEGKIGTANGIADGAAPTITPDPLTIVHPVRAVYMIERTVRVYVTIPFI